MSPSVQILSFSCSYQQQFCIHTPPPCITHTTLRELAPPSGKFVVEVIVFKLKWVRLLTMILLPPATVCQEFCPQGGGGRCCLPHCMLGYIPSRQTLTLGIHPLGRHPTGQTPPWQTPPRQTAPPPGYYGIRCQQAGGTHPTLVGMHTC